jgi:hypothetical protein
MISVFHCSANAMAAAVLPIAVGPTKTTSFFPFNAEFPITKSSNYYLSCHQNSPLRMIKYTNQFLTKLEDLIAESDYIMRYEKGNFKSGYCLLKEQKIMIVNKFFAMEGKINALLDILKNVELDTSKFSEKNLKLYEELTRAEVKI